jgi:Uma2 family endonuclease
MEAIKLENYTYEDYLDIDRTTQERVELIDGQIYMMAGASATHQDTVGNIFFILKNLSREKERCLPRIAPYDLKLFRGEDRNVVQPDVMLFCEEEIPCAIFEVLSDSTAYKDKSVKKELYERFGIGEYFLVDTHLKIVDKYELIDGKYFYVQGFGTEDRMPVTCLDDEIEIAEVFENIGESASAS